MKQMSNGLVSVVVVTMGKDGHIFRCLDGLKDQTYAPNEVIVIDNACNELFTRQLSQWADRVKIYTSPKNCLYCTALNNGISMSTADFALCLNDDVILEKGFIREALRSFEFDPKVGMVSGKILRPDKKTIDSTGLFLSVSRTAHERGYGDLDRGQFDREGYIFGVTGAVAFYRKRMLEEIKIDGEYFDSEFGIFFEDLDIAWRAQRFGWKGYYTPKAVAFHVRGATVRQAEGINGRYARRYLNDELVCHLIKNRYLSIIKNDIWGNIFLFFVFIILHEIMAYAYILFFRPRLIKKLFSTSMLIDSAFKKRILIRSRIKSLRTKEAACV